MNKSKFLLLVCLMLMFPIISSAQNQIAESASNLKKVETADETTAKPTKADPAAYELLKEAHDARQVWPADFAGFSAELSFNDNGKITKGTLSYEQKGVSLNVEGLD